MYQVRSAYLRINEANLILSRVNVINAPNQLITYFEIEDLLRTPLPKNLSTNVEFETVGSGLSPMTNIKSHNISRPEDFADPLTAITTVQRLKLASLEKSKTIEYDEFKSISRKLKRDSGFVESPIPLKLNEKRKFLRGPSSDVTVTDYGDVSDDEKDLKYEIDDLLC